MQAERRGGPALLARKQCQAISCGSGIKTGPTDSRRRLLQSFLDRIDPCHPFGGNRRPETLTIRLPGLNGPNHPGHPALSPAEGWGGQRKSIDTEVLVQIDAVAA